MADSARLCCLLFVFVLKSAVMAEGGKEAAISCPICLITSSSRLKVMSCGHVLCEGMCLLVNVYSAATYE